MKLHYIMPVFLVLAMVFPSQAQISEDDRSMSIGINNALILDLPDTDDKFADKLWKKFIKPYGGKVKKVKKSDEWLSDNAEIVGIGGANTIDIYAEAKEAGNDTELIMWIDLGGAFLSSDDHPDAYVEGEKLLMRYALFVAKEKTKMELEDEEKKLKKLESSLKKLRRDNERYHRDIENAKEKIKKAEANIVDNEVKQEETGQLIDMQKEAVQLVKQKLAELE